MRYTGWELQHRSMVGYFYLLVAMSTKKGFTSTDFVQIDFFFEFVTCAANRAGLFICSSRSWSAR